jgi:hypothetical protein
VLQVQRAALDDDDDAAGSTVTARALALALVAGCAAHPAEALHAPQPAASGPATGSAQPDPHRDIQALADQIEADRAAQEHSAPASPRSPQAMNAGAGSADLVCRPKTEACTTTCTLSDSICKNADSICGIAAGLVGDAWATDKCTHAKQACSTAHARCCGCS